MEAMELSGDTLRSGRKISLKNVKNKLNVSRTLDKLLELKQSTLNLQWSALYFDSFLYINKQIT